MKLSNRVVLLVAPVILISALVSSYIIYSIQKVTLIKREDSYIQLQMEKLAGQFRQANIFLNSYAYTLGKSEVLQDYFVNHDNRYRERQLFKRLDETIEVLSHGYRGDANMAILDGRQDLLYYTENQYYESNGRVDLRSLSMSIKAIKPMGMSAIPVLFTTAAGKAFYCNMSCLINVPENPR